MSVKDYLAHDMSCIHCASANVKRTYKSNTVVYKDDGFTKMVKEEIKEEE